MLKRIKEFLNRRGRKTDPEAAPSPASSHPAGAAPAGPPVVHRGPSVVHRPIPVAELDSDAVKIVQRLTRFDHAAYLVGGCVRDLLLDHRPKDFDIGTSATPRQIKRLFRNCRIIGRRFRLAHVYFQSGKIIEVATFRAQDGDDAPAAADGDLLIRDDNQFGTLEEDALRRDFTVNSLFYDVTKGNVLDHADGLSDLKRRLIRTIGDPAIRFREDPIRILRAVRFAARLDFSIETATLAALRRERHEIPRAAAPRILEEINRFCRTGTARRSFEMLRETDVFEIVLPEISSRVGGDDRRWDLLFGMLDGLDARSRNGREPALGPIFAALVLAAVADRIGWRSDGQAGSRPEGPTLAAVDEVLRPLALRLRVSRRDQEHCRQILETLVRMAPTGDGRRGIRRSLTRHPALPDALTILGAIGRLWAGPWADACATWNRPHEAHALDTPADGDPVAADAAAPAEGRRRSRRGRRGGRGRRRDGAPAAPAADRPTTASRVEREGPRREMPPVWDDNYFFAALPTAPDLTSDDAKPNRYGEGQVAGHVVPAERTQEDPPGEEPQPEPSSVPAAASGRRRRRRRRRGGAGSLPGPAPEGDDTPS